MNKKTSFFVRLVRIAISAFLPSRGKSNHYPVMAEAFAVVSRTLMSGSLRDCCHSSPNFGPVRFCRITIIKQSLWKR